MDDKRRIAILTTGFVETAATDVSNPLDDFVIGVIQFGFEYFQVTHLEAGWSERNLVSKN